MKMTRMIALSIPIAFLLMSFARPAAAMKPEVEELTGTMEGTYADCGTFKVEGRYSYLLRITTEFDNDGNPKTITYTAHYEGFAWNSVTGLTVRDEERLHVTYDVATGENRLSGPIAHWVIPGRGVVLMESGHSVVYFDGEFIVINHGRPHDLSYPWMDFTPMCAALA